MHIRASGWPIQGALLCMGLFYGKGANGSCKSRPRETGNQILVLAAPHDRAASEPLFGIGISAIGGHCRSTGRVKARTGVALLPGPRRFEIAQ
jgi:hypothetical protein